MTDRSSLPGTPIRASNRRARLALVVGTALALVTTTLSGIALAAPAAAAGTAGTPQAPATVFWEDFENANLAYTSLNAYASTRNPGVTYTADSFWLDRQQCNGLVARPTGSTSGVCTTGSSTNYTFDMFQRTIRGMIGALGTVNGNANNGGLGELANSQAPSGQVVFKTAQQVAVPSNGRFLVFSVNAAATTCSFAHPNLTFYAADAGGTETPLNGTPIDPCTDPRGSQLAATTPINSGAVFGGSFASDKSLLFTGDKVGIVLRNVTASTNGQGNDYAIDDIKILDGTPQLDKEFAPSAAIGGPAKLTFTITNTTDLAEKAGWSFTDALPSGLTVADPSSIATTCDATTVTAVAGSTSIDVTGTLGTGVASCTVTLNVTSAKTGAYTNGPDNLTTTGLDKPAAGTTVTFTAPALAVVPHAGTPTDVDGDGITDAGDTVPYTYTVTNTGDTPLTAVTVTDPRVGAVTCPTAPLAPGASMTCTADAPYTVTSADETAGQVDTSVTASGTGSGSTVTSQPGTTAVPIATPAPALTLVKSADPAAPADFRTGEQITYSFVLSNTGNIPLTDVAVDEGAFSGTGPLSAVTCPSSAVRLAPGAQTVCSATYTVTQADIDAGSVTNTAAGSATPVGQTAPISSAPSTATVPEPSKPGVSLTTSSDTVTATTVGQKITYTFTVTNTGNTTLTDVGVVPGSFGGHGPLGEIVCEPATALLPGETLTCTVVYTVVAADLNGTPLTLSATAVGTPPSGEPITSVPSAAPTATVVPAVAAAAPEATAALASTGSTVGWAAGLGGAASALLLAAGALLLLRRRTAE